MPSRPFHDTHCPQHRLWVPVWPGCYCAPALSHSPMARAAGWPSAQMTPLPGSPPRPPAGLLCPLLPSVPYPITLPLLETGDQSIPSAVELWKCLLSK